jgi:hypothetical protein
VAHQVERQNPAKVPLVQGRHESDHHGRDRHHEQQREERGSGAVEQQREDPHECVDAYLRQQSGEDGADRGGRGVIGRRQPEEEREQPGLDAERNQKQHRQHQVDARRARRRAEPGEIGHVERPGHTIQQPERREEDRRGDQVDRDVLERRLHLCAGAMQGHQHERCDQHHFEPHVQIEQVAGEEGA